MTISSNRTAPAAAKSSWLVVGRVLFLVILVSLLFWLANSMAHHRFHRGGWINHNDTLKP
jgi:formate-dependent nitrite reductase membrane component NrfD